MVYQIHFLNTYPPNITTPFEVKGVKSSLANTATEQDNYDIVQNKVLNETEIQLEKRRQRYKKSKANETTEVREIRLAKLRDMRKNQSSDKREKKLLGRRQKNRKNIISESSEARKTRLLKKHQQEKQVFERETTEHREKRLLNKRKQKKQAINNESDKQKENRLMQKRQKAKKAYHDRSAQSEESCIMKRFKKRTMTLEQLIADFHNNVSNGPVYICTCCDQLWYKHSVSLADKIRASYPNAVKLLQNITSVNNAEWLCQTCMKHLKSGKVPPLAVVNGMKFPEKPMFFDLNELECRLIAPRLAFQKIMQAPRGKQLKINGNVVNVPADVTNTVDILPRLPDQTGTIKVQLKRRLQYKSSALSLNIRPHKVLQAANWLASTISTLYQEQGIAFNPNWEINSNQNNELNEVIDDISEESDGHNSGKNTLTEEDDEFSEDEAEIPAGVTDSMLTPPDFVDDSERQHILNVAPGEGNRPLSVFIDKYSEELAYPGIFLGQQRPENKDRLSNVYYSDICKSELRRSDRRAAMCVENIFFKTKKLQMKLLLGKSQIALRKCKRNNSSLTAGQLKQEGSLEKLIHHDEGYKFLRALRGSPPYFEKAKKDLFAMIRQLDPATLFCSFSSAETKWMYLLKILGRLVDQKDYTDDELENLNWEGKCRLIQSDPVTCGRHFDFQFNIFLKKFLLNEIAPLGKIKDWFYRVEYQQRGSPHVHMLIWLEDAPVFGVDKDEDVSSFIDKIITCRKPDDDTTLLNLVNRQMHRHSHTRRKRGKSLCRFNYPQPPMRSTRILNPLESVSESDVKILKDLWKDIKKELNDLKEGVDITFDQLMENLGVSEERYILAIRPSLNSPTVFLKRMSNELRVNNYNPACLKAWRANMDIQYVLDVYACAMYIVSYISKAQKGMSELLRKACAEAKEGNSTIKQQVRDIGNKFLNSVEISAQEAVYIILQLPIVNHPEK